MYGDHVLARADRCHRPLTRDKMTAIIAKKTRNSFGSYVLFRISALSFEIIQFQNLPVLISQHVNALMEE
jgi:hypothetical protein